MNSAEAIELGNFLAERIPFKAKSNLKAKPWTQAVFEALREFSEKKSWELHPSDRPYVGEYLCDFTLFEKCYGCRIACESQWNHGDSKHESDLSWAFDKLRGVKADVKLFIFEGTEDHEKSVLGEYLQNYAQLSPEETFILLRWTGSTFVGSWWTPEIAGAQLSPVFAPF